MQVRRGRSPPLSALQAALRKSPASGSAMDTPSGPKQSCSRCPQRPRPRPLPAPKQPSIRVPVPHARLSTNAGLDPLDDVTSSSPIGGVPGGASARPVQRPSRRRVARDRRSPRRRCDREKRASVAMKGRRPAGARWERRRSRRKRTCRLAPVRAAAGTRAREGRIARALRPCERTRVCAIARGRRTLPVSRRRNGPGRRWCQPRA
jgi:hypothetical protein